MAETPELELDLLRRRAAACGMFVQRHRVADTMLGGDLYLQPRRTTTNPRPPSILKYARADQVHAALAKAERKMFGRRRCQ